MGEDDRSEGQDEASSIASDPDETPRGAVMLALGIFAAIVAGFAVVGIAGAFETTDDCPAYGYGGYGCVDYEDAQLVVEPSTDLVDYQIVTVTAIDFDPPFGTFVASQCAAADIAANGQDGCDGDTLHISTSGSTGRTSFTMRVKRVIETEALGDVDCAVAGACVIGAATVEGTFESYVVIEGTTAPISFDPNVPPTDFEDGQIFVDPATDLVDRQVVTVSGIDLDPPDTTFGAAQCDAALVQQFQSDACDLSTSVLSTVDGDGSVEVEMQVRRIITTAAGGEVDCAEPGACDIGGGTIEGFATPIEGDRVPISFDPAVPPVPPLEIDFDIGDAGPDQVSGTVWCNRAANFELSVEIVQERGGEFANAYGYLYDGPTCGTEPTAFTIPLDGGNRRLRGGPAQLSVWAYAYDGFEYDSTEDVSDIRIQGGSLIDTPAVAMDGTDTTVRILGSEGSADDQMIALEIYCGRAAGDVSVQVSVRQWAGLDRVTGYGYTQLDECDGTHDVLVPFTSDGSGVLVGGPARVDAWVYVQDQGPDGYFFDTASATDDVRLSGRVSPVFFDPVPNPDSRITIDGASSSVIRGTIHCEEPLSVELSGFGVQQRGRSGIQANGYDFLECDGVTPFSLDVSMYGGELKGGEAAISVWAYGYRTDVGTDQYYEYVWDDNQQASVKVRGSG